MKKRHTEGVSEYMEYPFGFGFELMNNPKAMKLFFSLDDRGQRELMKTVSTIRTREEMRGFLWGLTEELPTTRQKTP